MSPTPNQILARNNQLVKVPSKVSLTSIKQEQEEKLNRHPLRAWFDPYFKGYASTVVQLATKLNKGQKKFIEQNQEIPFPPEEVTAVEEWFDRIKDTGRQIKEAAARKDKDEARRKSVDIKEYLNSMQSIIDSSRHNAVRFKDNHRVWQMAMATYRKEGMTMRDVEHTVPCDWCARRNIQAVISGWFNNPGDHRILLLRGDRKSGKSTILHSVADLCRQQKALAASFQFRSTFKHQDFLQYFFGTVLDQLVAYLPFFGRYLIKRYGSLPLDFWKADFRTQIERALVPAHSERGLPESERTKAIVIALDGLEHCASGTLKSLITEFISQCVQSLPVYFIIADASSPTKSTMIDKYFSSSGLGKHLLPVDVAPFSTALEEAIGVWEADATSKFFKGW